MAYNQFRTLAGASPVTRAAFTKTVERHNATLAAKREPGVLSFMDELQDMTPEQWRKLHLHEWPKGEG